MHKIYNSVKIGKKNYNKKIQNNKKKLHSRNKMKAR